MSKMLKLIVFAFIFVAFSCSTESPITQDDLASLTSKVLGSNSFTSLGISREQLDASKAVFVSDDKLSIAIPFVTKGDRKGLIVLFDQNTKSVDKLGIVEMITDLKSEDFEQAMRLNRFDGLIRVNINNYEMEFTFANSKVVSSKSADRAASSGRSNGCNYFLDRGGALDCAGSRFADMNWLDRLDCAANIVWCMGKAAVSCWIDECKA